MLKMTARINGRSVTFSCVQSYVSLIRQEVALHFGTLRGLPVTVGTPHGLFTCLLDFIISDEICSDVGLGCDWFAFWKEYLRSEGFQVTPSLHITELCISPFALLYSVVYLYMYCTCMRPVHILLNIKRSR
jgi:hypothetical protein